MRVLNEIVAARRPDDLEVLHSVEHGKCSNGRSVTPELVGVDHVWDIVIRQEPFKKGFRCLGISASLQEKVEHRAGVIDGSPSLAFLATDLNADFIQKPPGTGLGFPVPPFFGEEGRELDVPLAQGFVAHLNAAFLEQFLNITLAQTEAVVEPKSVLNDAQREAAKRAQARPFWPRRGAGKACGRSQTVSLLRLTCQNLADKDVAMSGDARLNFFNGWLLRHNPRTAVRIMRDGTLLFVTVDGRNPTHSVGASIPELTTLLQNLGAVEAMNLDGGGSTATYVNGLLQGIPSDATGERPDGDAIVILPKP